MGPGGFAIHSPGAVQTRLSLPVGTAVPALLSPARAETAPGGGPGIVSAGPLGARSAAISRSGQPPARSRIRSAADRGKREDMAGGYPSDPAANRNPNKNL